MADLLPSSPDTSDADDSEPRVVGVDSEAAESLISALSSETARELLAALHAEPSNPSALAEAAGTSLQNAQYHLEKMQAANIVEIVDTCYSEKGREMKVYAPVDRPLIVYAGREQDSVGIQTALSRLLGSFGALAVASLVVQQLVSTGGPSTAGAGTDPVRDPGGAAATTETTVGTPTFADTATPATPQSTPTADTVATSTPQATPTPAATDAVTSATPVEAAGEAAGAALATIPPGALFFAGGAAVIVVAMALWYRQER